MMFPCEKVISYWLILPIGAPRLVGSLSKPPLHKSSKIKVKFLSLIMLLMVKIRVDSGQIS